MKKLLLSLMSVGFASVSLAMNSTTSFTINGFLGNYCNAAMTASNVTLSDLSQVSYGGDTLNVTCRPGTNYSLATTSANGWQLVSPLNYGVAYNIAYQGTVAGVASQWSGAVGSTTPVEVANGIISAGSTDAYPLLISNSIAPSNYEAGTYTDTVTVTITYS